MKDKPKMFDLVSRSFEPTINDEGSLITGIPIVFNQPTDIGGMFSETIQQDAISPEALKDVALFFNHDTLSKPLARTRTGKLRFTIEPDGVHMEADVNRERSDVNDLYLAIKDKDIDGMSFNFRVQEDEWTGLDSEYPHRVIKKIGYIQEVSAVTYPAYEQTSIQARSKISKGDQDALDSARQAAEPDHPDGSVDAETLELEKLKALYL